MAIMNIPVSSTCIAGMVYDSNTKTLAFTFHKDGGKPYIVSGIAKSTVDQWANSGSPGGFFNANIKGQTGHQGPTRRAKRR